MTMEGGKVIIIPSLILDILKQMRRKIWLKSFIIETDRPFFGNNSWNAIEWHSFQTYRRTI